MVNPLFKDHVALLVVSRCTLDVRRGLCDADSCCGLVVSGVPSWCLGSQFGFCIGDMIFL